MFSIDNGSIDVPFVVEHAEPTKTKAFATYGLSYAASKGKLTTELLDKLLELRANINWREKSKLQTCLHAAAASSNAKMVRELLQRGAKCDVRNINDRTPLHLALLKDNNVRSQESRLETVRALLEGNAEVDSICLDLAKQTGDDELIRLLTERHTADAERHVDDGRALGGGIEQISSSTRQYLSIFPKPDSSARNPALPMSGTHFAHLIRWHDLVWCLTHPASSSNPVSLPTGSQCQRIHPLTKRDHIILQNHKYLQPFACTDPDCPSSEFPDRPYVKTKELKNNGSDKARKLAVRPRFRNDQPKEAVRARFLSFFESFLAALRDVGAADAAPRIGARDEVADVIQAIKSSPDYDGFWSDGDCETFYRILDMSRADLAVAAHARGLLDFDVALSTNFGSQAVGNFWSFLLYYTLSIYFHTNIRLFCRQEGLAYELEYDGLRSSARADCDGRTFLHRFRGALADGVYITDLEATREMLKGCFRFFANFDAVETKVKGEAGRKERWLWRLPRVFFDIREIWEYTEELEKVQ
ncbi:hypothetical protein HK405_015110 [Cladochytrium tenue]|nr:hypothetical protein HK405_015110 [Cladochytrium tenue]